MNWNISSLFYIFFLFAFLGLACNPDDEIPCMDISCGFLTDIPCGPQSYDYEIPQGLPLLPLAVSQNTTVEGIALGRRLFYDPILSADSTMACAGCHLSQGSFTDNVAVSLGIDGIPGKRSSMSLLNVGYYDNGLFWDGRVNTLQEQALLPVEDPLELHAMWPDVLEKLRAHPEYPEYFRKAFCIDHVNEITRDLAAEAIAQFESIFISSGNSKFDRVLRGDAFFTDDELAGYELFFDLNSDLPDAECGHCHNVPLFTTNEYFNNGIDPATVISDFPDPGLGAVTMDESDYGKFRAPTLRNITFSAPYMHDGRFQTLEEVIDHYNSGGHPSINKDPLITPLGLSEEHKSQLLDFISTLDDPEFLTKAELQSPF